MRKTKIVCTMGPSTDNEEVLRQKGDLTVITSGIPIGISGTTNMIKVRIV